VEESGAEIVAREDGGSRPGLCCWMCGRTGCGEDEGMWEGENHMCQDGDGAKLTMLIAI